MGLLDGLFGNARKQGQNAFKNVIMTGASASKNETVQSVARQMVSRLSPSNQTRASQPRPIATPINTSAQSSNKPQSIDLVGATMGWLNGANAQASKFIKQHTPSYIHPGTEIYEKVAPLASKVAMAASMGPMYLALPKPVQEFQAGIPRGIYEDFVEKPVTAGASYVAGAALTGGVGLAGRAGAAVVGSKVVQNSPRLAPAASKIAAAAPVDKLMKGMGAIYAVDVGARVALPDQDPGGMGRRLGGIAATELGPMYLGGRTGVTLTSKVAASDIPFKLDSYITERDVLARLPASDVPAAKATFAISRDIKNVYSRMQNEPNLAKITNIGPEFADPMKAYISKQPHSIIGAGTRTGQIPESMWTRTTKDIDILVEDPMTFSKGALKGVFNTDYALEVVPRGSKPVAAIRTGGGLGSTAVDPHAFPEGYPIGKKSPIIDDYVEPYTIKFMPKELLRGPDLTQEYLYTQVQRKANAVIGVPKDAEWAFGPRAHRLKDSLDLVTDTQYLAGELKSQTSIFRPITSARNLAKATRLEKNADAIIEYYADPQNVKGYKDADAYLAAFQKLRTGEPLALMDIPEAAPTVNLVSIPKGSTYPFAPDISPRSGGAVVPGMGGDGISLVASALPRPPRSPVVDVPSSVLAAPIRSPSTRSPSTKGRTAKSSAVASTISSFWEGSPVIPVPPPPEGGSPFIPVPPPPEGGSPFIPVPPPPEEGSPVISPPPPPIDDISPVIPIPPPPEGGSPFIPVPPPPIDDDPIAPFLPGPPARPRRAPKETKTKKHKKQRLRDRDPYGWIVGNPVHDIDSFFGLDEAPRQKKKSKNAAANSPVAILSAPTQTKKGKPRQARRDPLAAPGKDFFEVKL